MVKREHERIDKEVASDYSKKFDSDSPLKSKDVEKPEENTDKNLEQEALLKGEKS